MTNAQQIFQADQLREECTSADAHNLEHLLLQATISV